MRNKTIEKIKLLCDGEIKFITSTNNFITVLLPYSTSKFVIEIEGNTDEDQIESFIDGVNKQLDDMIDHLEDCKL